MGNKGLRVDVDCCALSKETLGWYLLVGSVTYFSESETQSDQHISITLSTRDKALFTYS